MRADGFPWSRHRFVRTGVLFTRKTIIIGHTTCPSGQAHSAEISKGRRCGVDKQHVFAGQVGAAVADWLGAWEWDWTLAIRRLHIYMWMKSWKSGELAVVLLFGVCLSFWKIENFQANCVFQIHDLGFIISYEEWWIAFSMNPCTAVRNNEQGTHEHVCLFFFS